MLPRGNVEVLLEPLVMEFYRDFKSGKVDGLVKLLEEQGKTVKVVEKNNVCNVRVQGETYSCTISNDNFDADVADETTAILKSIFLALFGPLWESVFGEAYQNCKEKLEGE